MSTLTGYSVQDTLKRLFHFIELNDQHLAALTAICTIRKYGAGELVYIQGEEATSFYIVLGGKVQIYKMSSDGKEVILQLFGPGEMFAEISTFGGVGHYQANSLCKEDSEILVIESFGFQNLVQEYPKMALYLLRIFAQRLHQFSELIEDLSLRTVDSRLAKYLLSVSENSPDKAVIYIHKKTLAGILGTVPQMLSKTFKKFTEKGLIPVEENRIHLLNREVLIRMAGA
jgi:CRP/FNR family transcriptional regulator